MFKDFLQTPPKSKKGKKTTVKKYGFEINVDRHVETNIREYILWEIKKEKPEKRKKKKAFIRDDVTSCNDLDNIHSVKEKKKETKQDRKKNNEVRKYKEKEKELKLQYMRSIVERKKCITKCMKALNEEMIKYHIVSYEEKAGENGANSEANGKEIKEVLHEEVNEKVKEELNGKANEELNGKVNEELNGKVNEELNRKVNEELNGTVNEEINEEINGKVNGDVYRENSM